MRRFVLVLFLVITLCDIAHSQTEKTGAVKFDEFGDILPTDLIARLDNLCIEVQKEPASRIFLVVYRSHRDPPGLNSQYLHHMKSYLLYTRGIRVNRIVTDDGGVSTCLIQELWIVPVGATPKAREDAYFGPNYQDAYIFDEHYYYTAKDNLDSVYWAQAPGDLTSYLEAFADALQKSKGSTGYLVAYKDARVDGPNVSRIMLQTEKLFLIWKLGIGPARIKTLNGGYRESRTMELWIVPPKTAAPIITTCGVAKIRRRR